MPVCCLCGKKTLNVYIRDHKAYCKSCMQTAGMVGPLGMANPKFMTSSEEEVHTAYHEGKQLSTMNTASPIREFKGANGKILLYQNKIVIKKGLLDVNGKNQKEIYLSEISGIQLKKPSLLGNGYIQMIFNGSLELKRKAFKSTDMDLVKDENTILIKSNANYEEAVQLKSYIERLKNESQVPTVVLQTPVSVADELIKLKELLDAGVLSQEEFNEQKSRLLNH